MAPGVSAGQVGRPGRPWCCFAGTVYITPIRFVKHDPTYLLGRFFLPVVTQRTDLGVSYDNRLSFRLT
jgi:hypothetical protein